MRGTRVERQLRQRATDLTSYSYGTVTAVSPLTVRLDLEITAVQTSYASTYFPVVGDRVLVLVQGADRIVIGSATPNRTWTTGVTGTVTFGATTNVTSSRRHRVIDGMCEVEYGWTITGAVTAGTLFLNLPFGAIVPDGSSNADLQVGTFVIIDQGVTRYEGYCLVDTGNLAAAACVVYSTNASVTSSSPFAPGSTDGGSAVLRYRVT